MGAGQCVEVGQPLAEEGWRGGSSEGPAARVGGVQGGRESQGWRKRERPSCSPCRGVQPDGDPKRPQHTLVSKAKAPPPAPANSLGEMASALSAAQEGKD